MSSSDKRSLSEEQINRLREAGFRVNRMTQDDLRLYLKSKGWRRHDLGNEEYWCHEAVPSVLGVSLKSAVRNQLKFDGYSS